MYDSKHFRPVSTNIWAISFPLSIFAYVFQLFQIFSFLGSVSDGHFAEHWKWLLWLLWNYCQTIQISRKTTIDDLFLYQLPITRYLQIYPDYSTVQLLYLWDKKVRLSITNAIKCPSLTKNKRAVFSLAKPNIWHFPFKVMMDNNYFFVTLNCYHQRTTLQRKPRQKPNS